MNRGYYYYERCHTSRYVFTSIGQKGAILKAVQFEPTSLNNVYNLSFGDLRADDTIDDYTNSNNHDIAKIMVTIISIVDNFTRENAVATVFFTGNSSVKTLLYKRILDMYYHVFSKPFFITALIKEGSSFKEVIFQENSHEKYLAFMVKRK